MWWLWEQLAGNTSAIDARCVAAQASGSEWLCLFAEQLARFVKTPIFALQSFYDSYQIGAIAHANATAPADAPGINAFGAALKARVKSNLLAGAVRHGAALDGCTHHCGNAGTVWPAVTFNATAGGHVAQNGAWHAWYAGGAQRTYEQAAAYPCKECCGTRVTEPARGVPGV